MFVLVRTYCSLTTGFTTIWWLMERNRVIDHLTDCRSIMHDLNRSLCRVLLTPFWTPFALCFTPLRIDSFTNAIFVEIQSHKETNLEVNQSLRTELSCCVCHGEKENRVNPGGAWALHVFVLTFCDKVTNKCLCTTLSNIYYGDVSFSC